MPLYSSATQFAHGKMAAGSLVSAMRPHEPKPKSFSSKRNCAPCWSSLYINVGVRTRRHEWKRRFQQMSCTQSPMTASTPITHPESIQLHSALMNSTKTQRRKMKVADLREELEKLGLETTGKKDELLDRLESAISQLKSINEVGKAETPEERNNAEYLEEEDIDFSELYKSSNTLSEEKSTPPKDDTLDMLPENQSFEKVVIERDEAKQSRERIYEDDSATLSTELDDKVYDPFTFSYGPMSDGQRIEKSREGPGQDFLPNRGGQNKVFYSIPFTCCCCW